MTESLRIDDLHVPRGGRPVLHGVSLEIPAGEITTLLGPNGAGKSTLVLTIGGVLPSTAGSISLDGVELRGAKPEKVRTNGIAVVPEGRRLLPSLSVEDNLKVATYNLPAAEARAGIDEALELFPELHKRFELSARSLSGGEQQMVVLAQALASKPKIVVVDELSLGLAPVGTSKCCWSTTPRRTARRTGCGGGTPGCGCWSPPPTSVSSAATISGSPPGAATSSP
jgi:branched-chain amino acid transport system ATP-binding protein